MILETKICQIFDKYLANKRELTYTGSVTALEQIDQHIAELKKQLHEPATCHSGHTTHPITLWDCPECTDQLRKDRKRLIEIAQMLFGGIMTADLIYSIKGMEAFKELDREVREMENRK